ncbi:MAG TPA: hypothetical protein PLG66_11850 [Calditrichia bacterium]|nr:hypothetical protein [Calditrichia bacterium]
MKGSWFYKILVPSGGLLLVLIGWYSFVNAPTNFQFSLRTLEQYHPTNAARAFLLGNFDDNNDGKIRNKDLLEGWGISPYPEVASIVKLADANLSDKLEGEEIDNAVRRFGEILIERVMGADSNGDGYLSPEEWEAVLKIWHHDQALDAFDPGLPQNLGDWDANSDAVLDRPEVELGIAGLAVRAFRAYDAAYRLRSFDANGDGLLSPTELSGIDLEWRVPGGTQQQAGERGITPFQLQEKLLQLSEDRLTDIQYWLARNNPEALP